MNTRPPNAPDQKPAFAGQTRAPEQKLNVAFDVVTVTEGLVNPWGLAFLPDGKMLVTEKPGRLRVVSADGKTMSEPVAGLPAVDARGQGGLLDVALDPAFQKNQLIYWSYAEPRDERHEQHRGRARQASWTARRRRSRTSRSSSTRRRRSSRTLHFGGRLVFGRDGTLFITHGDRSITEGRMQAQKHGQPARQDRAHQRRRLDPQGQPVRRQGRRAAGDLVVRPPQHPGGDAAPARPASCGRSSTARAAATRSTSRAKARTTAGRRSPTASSIRARRSPAASSSRRAWSSRSTTGIRSSRRAA